MAVNIGPRIGIDGEAEYRKQIQAIIQETKTLKSEYDKASSALDKDTSSIKKNAEQKKILNQQIEAQQKRIAELSRMMEESSKKYGENDQKTLKWKEAVNQATTELNNLRAKLSDMPSMVQMLGNKFEEAGNKIKGAGDKITAAGQALAPLSAAAAGVLAGSAKAAIDFESAFTGVQKTVDATAGEYEQLSSWIKEASTQMASSKTDIAGVMEAAGQLGVSGVRNLEEFTQTMVMLGDTTNLSSDDAATSLARFMNITGTAYTQSSNLGSAIVELGNNFATSESEIVEMATRLASAGTIAGLTETDILALSASMSSVGINAEAGGTAMTQTLEAITKEVANFRAGSENDLERIADISGMSAAKFAATWENRPIAAIQSFIEGLGNLDEKGENATLVLDELGMSGVRQSNMLKSLALASDVLGGAVSSASSAWEENNALQDEAALRYQTTAAQMEQAKEKLTNIGIEIGERLLPYLDKGIEVLDRLVAAWDGLSTEEQDAIVQMAMVTAAAAPLLMGAGKMVSTVGTLVSAGGKLISFFGGLAPAAGTAATAMEGAGAAGGAAAAGLGAILAPAAAAIAVAAVLAGAFVTLYKTNDEFKAHVDAAWQSIQGIIGGAIDFVEQRFDYFKQKFSGVGEDLKNAWMMFSNALEPIFSAGIDYVTRTFENWVGIIEGIFDVFAGVFTGDWRQTLTGVQEIAAGILNSIIDTFRFGLDTIENFFKSMKLEFPHIKLPHFKIEGKLSLDPPSVPHISVDWYAKAMSDGMILKGATIFGAANGKLLGGGEAGAEAVVGVNSLRSMITSAVQTALLPGGNSTSISYGDTVINVYGAPGQDVEELADMIEDRLNYKIQAQNAVTA